jgi:20S proteasome alpha/beta subunit
MDSKVTSTEVDVTVRTREGMTLEEVFRVARCAIRKQFPPDTLILGDILIEVIAVDKAEDL